MKYVVFGAGGTGGILGGQLAKGGQDVTLIARGAHLAAIQVCSSIVSGMERARPFR